MSSWQTRATLEDLRARSKIIQKIRHFFISKNVLEVETPLLSLTTNPDPNIESFITNTEPRLYLQTSPEFYMKKLLATYSIDIFQICKAFRKEEFGSNHQKEFTMLEWYRVGMSYHELMDEVYEMLSLFIDAPKQKITYKDLFVKHIGLDPFRTTVVECQEIAKQYKLEVYEQKNLDLNAWLDLLLSQIIEPAISHEVVFIYDYLPSQASLAKIRDGQIAERFELYLYGVEIANGFAELTQSKEQLIRFQKDNLKRKQENLSEYNIDYDFLMALENIPECSGVAIGLDRMIKICLGRTNLHNVMTFAD